MGAEPVRCRAARRRSLAQPQQPQVGVGQIAAADRYVPRAGVAVVARRCACCQPAQSLLDLAGFEQCLYCGLPAISRAASRCADLLRDGGGPASSSSSVPVVAP